LGPIGAGAELIIESARIGAAFRGQAMADLVGDILRPAPAKMEQDEMAKRVKSKEAKK
jgi:hypothetical protein